MSFLKGVEVMIKKGSETRNMMKDVSNIKEDFSEILRMKRIFLLKGN